MSPATIIKEALADGVKLVLTNSGRIKASGDQSVVNRWLPAIQESKAEISAELQRQDRLERVLATLATNPSINYAVEVVDPVTDPVIVTVGVRHIAAFELEIPFACYNGLTLLELIEAQTGQKSSNI
jgi:hypothetical protein